MADINVREDKLKELTGKLETALKNFKDSFNALETGLVDLTSKGYTGAGATALMNSYRSNAEPKLREVENTTKEIIDYMERQTVGFKQTLDTSVDIANGKY